MHPCVSWPGAGGALRVVEVHRDYRAEPLRDDTARLRSAVDWCLEVLQAIEDEDAAEPARLSFFGHLSEVAAISLARAVSFDRAEHGEFKQMADEPADGAGAAFGLPDEAPSVCVVSVSGASGIGNLLPRTGVQCRGSCAPSRRKTGMRSKGAAASRNVPPFRVSPLQGSVQVAPAGR